ncbi:nucleotidyltransferase domain-containing protein [Streptomyces sp. NPDC004059]
MTVGLPNRGSKDTSNSVATSSLKLHPRPSREANGLVAVLQELGFAVFDREGNGNYTMENGEVWVYAAAWFDGSGIIRGEAVRCLTAEAQVLCHTGYPLDDEDRQDMAALQRRFGLELLPEQTQGRPT